MFQILASVVEPEEVDRGEVLSLEQKHDHAETRQTIQTAR